MRRRRRRTLDLGRRRGGDRRPGRDARADRAQIRRAGRARSCKPTRCAARPMMRPGQRLVIPRYVSTRGAPPCAASPRRRRAARRERLHRRARRDPDVDRASATASRSSALAKANKIEPVSARSASAMRLTIPAGGTDRAGASHAPAPQAAAAHGCLPRQVSSVPVAEARSIAKPDVHVAAKRRQDRRAGRRHAVVPLAGAAAASSPASARGRTARRTTASIWRCRKARRSRPPRTASSPMPATSSRATAIWCWSATPTASFGLRQCQRAAGQARRHRQARPGDRAMPGRPATSPRRNCTSRSARARRRSIRRKYLNGA